MCCLPDYLQFIHVQWLGWGGTALAPFPIPCPCIPLTFSCEWVSPWREVGLPDVPATTHPLPPYYCLPCVITDFTFSAPVPALPAPSASHYPSCPLLLPCEPLPRTAQPHPLALSSSPTVTCPFQAFAFPSCPLYMTIPCLVHSWVDCLIPFPFGRGWRMEDLDGYFWPLPVYCIPCVCAFWVPTTCLVCSVHLYWDLLPIGSYLCGDCSLPPSFPCDGLPTYLLVSSFHAAVFYTTYLPVPSHLPFVLLVFCITGRV